MKNLVPIAKKSLKFLSIIAFICCIGSCEEKEPEIFWNDGEAAVITSVSPESAMEGDEVTILGKYFSSTANNTVSFNGTEAEIVLANLTQIIAIVPLGATPGDIAVTSDGHLSNALPFTVTYPIIPTITSIDPESAGPGDDVTITGTNFSTTADENVVSFNGAIALVTESTATTIITTVPALATTGDVTVTLDGEVSNGVMFTFSAPLPVTFTTQITESSDDAEEGSNNGAMVTTSSDLELGEYDTWTQDDVEQGLQTIGLRFPGIEIPANAEIVAAYITFTCDATGDGPAEMTIFGENVGDPVTYSEEFYDITSRSKTEESVIWPIPVWEAEGDAGEAQKTTDIMSVVQALVNREDWASGNSMAFIFEHSGVSIGVTSSSAGREAETADGSSDGTLAPVLTIVYLE